MDILLFNWHTALESLEFAMNPKYRTRLYTSLEKYAETIDMHKRTRKAA